MLITLTYLAVVLGVVGSIANAYRQRWAFLLWIVANIILIRHNILRGDWPQVMLFSIYSVIAIVGLWQWRKK